MSIEKDSQIKKYHPIENNRLFKRLDTEKFMKHSKLDIEEKFIQNISTDSLI